MEGHPFSEEKWRKNQLEWGAMGGEIVKRGERRNHDQAGKIN